jgi:hypothetical protein
MIADGRRPNTAAVGGPGTEAAPRVVKLLTPIDNVP